MTDEPILSKDLEQLLDHHPELRRRLEEAEDLVRALRAGEGEAVFVVGNPGSTQRQFTNAQLAYLRDVQYPAQLAVLNAQRRYLLRVRDTDSARWMELRDNFFSIEN